MPIISSPVKIDEETLASFLGGNRPDRLSRAIKNKIHRLKKQFSHLIAPRLTYRDLSVVQIAQGRIRLKNDYQLVGPKLARALASCRKVVCFIATIGSRIEKEVNALVSKHRLADAFILDAIGSAAVETMVDRFHANYDNELRNKSQATTYRFSPGYCDWSIEEQKKIFDLFDEDFLEVKLSDTCLMSPRKSISGVFGISSKGSSGWVSTYNPCRECSKKDCTERRK